MIWRFRICLIILLFIFQFQDSFALKEFDSSLINSKTGQKFSELLIDSFTTDLLNIAKDKKNGWLTYSSSDLAAVQAIQSMEKSLFDLSAYYAQNKSTVIFNKYLDGLAIEYATIRCDSVVSNRFPRNMKLLQAPWSDHKDYIYYDVNCLNNATDILSRKYQSLHHEVRVKRDLSMIQNSKLNGRRTAKHLREMRLRRSVNDPQICGSKVLYEGMNGNITSPGYPGNYSAGITCVWQIKVPVKYAVTIQFDTFNMEYDKRCLYDSVEFFDGASVNSKSIIRICGTNPPNGIRSSLNYLTIRMKTDGNIESSGFVLKWNYTDPNYPHPGYIVTSNIIVDQLGPNPNDLNKYALIFKKPTTCPLQSNDVFCYFQYDAVIISRIVSTITLPQLNMHGAFVDVKLDHIIELKEFPTLYRSKKYCMRWNSTVAFTEIGAWSRYGGKVYRTDDFSTTCRYNEPGIYAVFAEHHFTVQADAFRFTGTFYAGIFFSIVWLIVLISQWAFSRRINVPEWINFNQAISLVLFLGTVLCGLHLEFVKSMCSLLAFFLYYFGLGVFFWQFLKAAQVSGKFDEFFAEGRNVYLFYFLLGWILPMFIAGMAAGAMFSPSKTANNCWLALVGGTIWGYTAPTYFLVIGNIWILYKVSKKTKKNLKKFNHSQLRKRIVRDLLQLILYIMTWVFGVLCILNKTQFSLQFMFSLSITLSVLFMSLAAKQRRPGYQKIHYIDYKEFQNREEKEDVVDNTNDKSKDKENLLFNHAISMKAYQKWKKFRKHELKLGQVINEAKRGKSIDYNAYYALDEEGSQYSIRASSSIKSASILKPGSDRHTPESDQNSGSESELDLESSNEEEKRSTVSTANSRINMQTNEIEDRGTSYIDKNEATDQESEDDAGLDYEDTSRKSMYSTADIHKSGTISNNRNSPQNTQINEREATFVEPEEKSETDEGNEIGAGNDEVLNKYSNKDEEDEEGDRLDDGAPNDGEKELSKYYSSDDENDKEEGVNESGKEDEDEEEIDENELPTVTVNAFGGDSDNEEGNEGVLPRSLQPSRSLRAKQTDDDKISVCSLEDEEEVEEKDNDIDESYA